MNTTVDKTLVTIITGKGIINLDLCGREIKNFSTWFMKILSII